MKLSDFDYELPSELIAQVPIEPRDSSRLLVLDRETGKVEHKHFYDFGDYLVPGDLVVVNRSRVVPARLFGNKQPGGGKVEILLLERIDPLHWKALVGGKGLDIGKKVLLPDGLAAEVIQDLGGSQRLLAFNQEPDSVIERSGKVPLPPYIRTPLADPERYQTVFARQPGSAAAPTAGLHFTPELIDRLKQNGVGFAEITLHVGLDTFAPVTEEDPSQHLIHSEWCSVSAEAVDLINRARTAGKRIVAVGTTSVRTLESAAATASDSKTVAPFEGRVKLFILPGYKFRVVDSLITNFHLPRSTLLMLVSAFAGRERILDLYRQAIDRQYRFYSFGDAMLLI